MFCDNHTFLNYSSPGYHYSSRLCRNGNLSKSLLLSVEVLIDSHYISILGTNASKQTNMIQQNCCGIYCLLSLMLYVTRKNLCQETALKKHKIVVFCCRIASDSVCLECRLLSRMHKVVEESHQDKMLLSTEHLFLSLSAVSLYLSVSVLQHSCFYILVCSQRRSNSSLYVYSTRVYMAKESLFPIWQEVIIDRSFMYPLRYFSNVWICYNKRSKLDHAIFIPQSPKLIKM